MESPNTFIVTFADNFLHALADFIVVRRFEDDGPVGIGTVELGITRPIEGDQGTFSD